MPAHGGLRYSEFQRQFAVDEKSPRGSRKNCPGVLCCFTFLLDDRQFDLCGGIDLGACVAFEEDVQIQGNRDAGFLSQLFYAS